LPRQKLPHRSQCAGTLNPLTNRSSQPLFIPCTFYEVRLRQDHRGVDLISDVLLSPAPAPKAILSLPVVLFKSAPRPIAVFWFPVELLKSA